MVKAIVNKSLGIGFNYHHGMKYDSISKTRLKETKQLRIMECKYPLIAISKDFTGKLPYVSIRKYKNISSRHRYRFDLTLKSNSKIIKNVFESIRKRAKVFMQ